MNRDFKYPTYLGLMFLVIGGLTAYNATMAYKFDDGTLMIKLIVVALAIYATVVHFTANHVQVLPEGVNIKKNIITSPKLTKWQDISSLETKSNKIIINKQQGASTTIHKSHIKSEEWPDLTELLEKNQQK
jgi:hypothetical protein